MDKFNKALYGQEYWLNDVLYRTQLEREYYKGFNERNYEIARNLLENTNTSVEDICKCTGLSTKEVNKLKKSIK